MTPGWDCKVTVAALEEVMDHHVIRQLKAIALVLVISYFGACAPVKFDTETEKADNVVEYCEGSTCFYEVTEEKTVGEGLVDILIVNDNSGSMSFEQRKMADAFSGFLSSMQNLDYRIAMTTTDISDTRQRVNNVTNLSYNPAGPYNGYGALQDGKLIDFASGLKYLDRNTPNKQTLFDATIRRPETAHCESTGFAECPGSDERGIVAAGMTIKNYAAQFMRPTAHFAVIVLSDEDERGVSKYNPCNYSTTADRQNCEAIKRAYPMLSSGQKIVDSGGISLYVSANDQRPAVAVYDSGSKSEMDEPQTFVNSFRSLFPNKTMSFHTIIVRPGDISCRNAQTGQGGSSVLGQEGYAYKMVRDLVGGVDGNICASNYTNQLQNIGYTIGDKVTSLPFRCRPVNDQYEVLFSGTPATSGFSADFNTMTLTVTADLDARAKVTLKYTCAK